MTQYEVDLPIACVEGWSQTAHWKGVRLRDLVNTVKAPKSASVRATSLEKGSIYAVTELEPNFVQDDLTLVALEVDGKTLDINHGYPARLIAPARPGVLQTKWLSTHMATNYMHARPLCIRSDDRRTSFVGKISPGAL